MKNKIIKQCALIMIAILSYTQIQAASIINESFLKKINSDGDETSCTMTGNMKTFIFARKPKGGENSDLYMAELKNGKWTEPAALSALNSDSDELSPYISPDGKFILFSSNRPGSLKNITAVKPSFDIYFSEKNAAGWGKPELLFGAVNTRDDELSPSITKKGNLLYFTRSRFNDSSRTTIVKVYYKNESWEDVSTAEISRNTGFDIYMYKNSEYKSGAYISGFKKGVSTSRDIFYSDTSGSKITELTNPADPVNTTADEISVNELNNDSIIVSSDSAGSYDFFIKKISAGTIKEAAPVKSVSEKKGLPETFSLMVESKNYSNTAGVRLNALYFSSLGKDSWPVKTEIISPDQSGMINLTAEKEIKRILILPGESDMKPFSAEFITNKNNINAAVIKIEPADEKEFTVKPVYFNFNSSDILITEVPYLQDLIEHLRNNNDQRLSLDGYADGIGSYKANLDLSLRRAERIKDFLVKAGISKERIKTQGFGYINVKVPDTSQNNRRVESIIINQ